MSRQGTTEVDLVTPRRPAPQDSPRLLTLFKASAAIFPSRHLAVPLLLPVIGLVLVVIGRPPSRGEGLAPVTPLFSIVPPNYLGSWNVFLSLFESFKEATTDSSLVLLQDPPVSKAYLFLF